MHPHPQGRKTPTSTDLQQIGSVISAGLARVIIVSLLLQHCEIEKTAVFFFERIK